MRRTMEQKAEDLRLETIERVQKEVSRFSLSAEIWQTHYEASWGGRSRYLALLCHHVSAEFESATFPLGVVYVPTPEDGGDDALLDELEAMLTESRLEKRNLSTFLNSNDNLVRRAASALEAKSFPDIWAVVHSSLLHWIWRPEKGGKTSQGLAAPRTEGRARSKQAAQSSVYAVVAEMKALADALIMIGR